MVLPLPRHHHVDSVFSLESAASVDSGALDPGCVDGWLSTMVFLCGAEMVRERVLARFRHLGGGGEGA